MNSFQRRVFHHPLPTSHFDEIDYVHSSYSFPEKLYIILENSSIESAQWAENGICFRIVNEEVFLDKVMPQYFKQTKMTSFQRQLNSYGFRKISRGGESGCYFHPKFQKGRPDLLLVVQRLPAKGSLESYEEVQFSKQKEVSFDYERTNTKKRVRKEEKKTVNKVPHYQKSPTFVGHVVSPVSAVGLDDSSISSLSSGENEISYPTLPAPRTEHFKGPYLFLGAPKPMNCDDQLQQYQLYEQHCRDRVAHQQYHYYQQGQMGYPYEQEAIPMFQPYPVIPQYEYVPSAPSGLIPMTDAQYSVDESQLDYSFLKSDVLDMLLNPLPIEQQEQEEVPHLTESKDDWADSLLNMAWVTASSDDFEHII